MKKRIILLFILIAFAAFEGFYYSRSLKKTASDFDYQKAFLHSNKVFSLILPDTAIFAGEMTPMGLYYVREGLDRELMVNTYWQSSTLLMLKRSNRYFNSIIPILKKNKVPEDFKYLVLIESGLANVESPAGAAGFWQIVPLTGKRYGLEITDQVDERYNLEKSTETACKILKNAYIQFGSWTLAAAAYNAGENRIAKAIETQKVQNYYDLYLPGETMRYVFRILALKLLYEHPTDFGYYIRKKDLYPPIPTYTIAVDSSINDLTNFSKSLHINFKILKEFNPWLRKDKLLNPGKKIYVFTIPKKGFEEFDNLMKDIENAEQIFNDTISAGSIPK